MYYILCPMHYYILIKESGTNGYWTDTFGKKWERVFLELVFTSGSGRFREGLALQQNEKWTRKCRGRAVFGEE